MNMIEMFSAIIIVVPLIVPVALQYGIDPIHLGVIFLLNLLARAFWPKPIFVVFKV